MDDTPKDPRGQGRTRSAERGRASLVERAAGKLAARPGGAPPHAADAGPEAEVPLPVNDHPWQEPPPAGFDGLAGSLPLQQVDASLADIGEASADSAQLSEPPRSKQRKARSVELNLSTLQANQIFIPGTKRNRSVEEFRLIKRMVLSRRWDESDLPGNAIVVTSALPAEGKTTTAINLAMSIAAEEDLHVLLIDADFIKPDALRKLGVSAGKGLIDVIQDPRMDISDVILRTNIEKLSLIPAGQLHDRCTELLASARMDDLITELATRYEDRILIFDSPPLLATTESVVLASHMGQVVFVVESGRTKRDSVANALELLGERHNLGIILNRTRTRFGSTQFGAYYGSYYYGYGHDRGGSEERT